MIWNKLKTEIDTLSPSPAALERLGTKLEFAQGKTRTAMSRGPKTAVAFALALVLVVGGSFGLPAILGGEKSGFAIVAFATGMDDHIPIEPDSSIVTLPVESVIYLKPRRHILDNLIMQSDTVLCFNNLLVCGNDDVVSLTFESEDCRVTRFDFEALDATYDLRNLQKEHGHVFYGIGHGNNWDMYETWNVAWKPADWPDIKTVEELDEYLKGHVSLPSGVPIFEPEHSKYFYDNGVDSAYAQYIQTGKKVSGSPNCYFSWKWDFPKEYYVQICGGENTLRYLNDNKVNPSPQQGVKDWRSGWRPEDYLDNDYAYDGVNILVTATMKDGTMAKQMLHIFIESDGTVKASAKSVK